jgi:hypothetical protein
MKDIEIKIDRVLESFFVKDLVKALDGTILKIKLDTLAKIENALIEVK